MQSLQIQVGSVGLAECCWTRREVGDPSPGGSCTGEVPNSEIPLFSRPASDSGRPATSTLNRFSALQQSTPAESLESRRVVQR